MTTGFYPDFADSPCWHWIGTLCAGEHRENCGCPGTPGFRHMRECRCYDPPVMNEYHEEECYACHGTGKVRDYKRGRV